MKQIDQILYEDEKIIWESVPKFWAYFISHSLGAVSSLAMTFATFMKCWVKLLIFILIVISVAIFAQNTYYTITDKRIIIQTGWLSPSYKIMDLENIVQSEVNIGFFDKMLSTNYGNIGSISVYNNTKRKGVIDIFNLNRGCMSADICTFENISNPYELIKLIKSYKNTATVVNNLEVPDTANVNMANNLEVNELELPIVNNLELNELDVPVVNNLEVPAIVDVNVVGNLEVEEKPNIVSNLEADVNMDQ